MTTTMNALVASDKDVQYSVSEKYCSIKSDSIIYCGLAKYMVYRPAVLITHVTHR